MKKFLFWIKNTTVSNKITIVILLGIIFVAIFFGKSRYEDSANKKLNSNLEALNERESTDIIAIEEIIDESIELNSISKSNKDSGSLENEDNNASEEVNSNSEIFSKTLFVGDSWALEMKRAKYVRDYNIIAKKNQNISEFENILSKIINLNPSNIVIMIGNDTIKSISTARLNSAYKKIIEDIKFRVPKAKLFVVSLSEKDKNNKIIKNINIEEFNEILKGLTAERDGVFIETKSISSNIEKDGYPLDSFFEKIAEIVKNNIKKSNI